ncbi:MAG: C39 family peptidase [Gammaproteobacteria bacterium]|nr:C39 family peptidase [Gammaproteobacteria bacterium]MDH3465873.1 C39 family peptidase [Gammaproteobacteria bacterium]
MRYLIGVMMVALLTLTTGVGGGAAVLAADSAPPVRSLLEMRHQNVVLQQWELSCAAASLATILRYQHGVPVTERSVALGLIDREEYIANPELVRLRQGFSLLDLKRFVDTLGYEGIGLGQLAFPDLLERAPIIVPVNLQGYPHFVIFRGATSNAVLLADPAFGNVSMSITKFINGWIEYQDIGRVGFVVTKAGMLAPPGRLSARASDFVVLK